MPTLITNPLVPITSMLGHCWTPQDLLIGFGLPTFTSSQVSVSSHISPWLDSEGYKAEMLGKNGSHRLGVFVKDEQITSCLMNQALDYLRKAVCNAIGHYLLASRGLETWARVTNYYAGYFSVHSLLCLQGRTITHLNLNRNLRTSVVAVDIKNHEYGISISGLDGREHQVPWNRYYQIYDRFSYTRDAFSMVTKLAYVTDPTDESTERNQINYSPFQGFREIYDVARCGVFVELYDEYKTNLGTKSSLDDFLDELSAYATDVDRRYFARTLLRIALAGDIIRQICQVNPKFKSEWETTQQQLNNILLHVFPTPDSYLLKFIPMIGT